MSLVGDRYETIRELGRGGMGQVLLARQVNLGRLVVIKCPLPEHSLAEVKVLLDEARLGAKLSHPAIVGILDVSAVPPYIAMEYVAGLTVRELIADAPNGLPPAVVLSIALDILRGLVYAHGEPGVIHRDIKPRNIIVTFTGNSKLIDFGISRWLSQEGSWDSTSKAGTPGYMAPEQQRGSRLDARVDQFAVGVTMREMLFGFDSMTASAEARPVETAPELSAIIERATAQRPEDRYPSCSELAAALEAYTVSAGIAPSPAIVERWIRDHHAEAIERWRRESSGRIDTEMVTRPESARPLDAERLTPSRSAVGTGAGSKPATVKRSRFTLWAILAALGVGGIVGITFALTRSASTPAPLVVDVVATNAGTADDNWLSPAVEQMTRQELRDAGGRRFLLARQNAAPTLTVEISYRVTPRGVTLAAKRQGHPLAQAEGESVASAAHLLATKLVAEVGKDRPIAGPDAEEVAQMAKLGARTYDLYRRYRTVTEQVRISGYTDTTAAVVELEAIQHADPTWPRIYSELAWTRENIAQGSDALSEAHRRGDGVRDPAGMNLVKAREAIDHFNYQEAERLLAPVFANNDADMIVGEVLFDALTAQGKSDAGRAVGRRLAQRFPASTFAGEIVADLEHAGRRDQAATLAASLLVEHPYNISVVRELVRIEADRGNLDIARRWANRMLLLYGDGSLAATELFEAMLSVDDLAAAQRVVDAMLLDTPLMRARGYFRAAVVAVYEGRLEIAQTALNEAIPRFAGFGGQSELPQCLALARAIAQLRHNSAAAADAAQKLTTWYEQLDDPAGAISSRFREHVSRTGTCEPIDAALGTLEEPDRSRVNKDIVRIAAAAGCATCDQVLAAGTRDSETTSETLITYGLCARKAGDLTLAKRTLDLAATWSSWSSSEQATPVHAILAQYHLAGVLLELGDKPGARARYERFLRYWGEMTNPIPEIAKARAALSTL